MIIYYAHSVHLYNTEQEKRDIAILESLGFNVFSPNQGWVQKLVENFRDKNPNLSVMQVFDRILDKCDILAFRAHVDGKISSGVWYEIEYMRNQEKPIIELPNFISNRPLSREDTKEYLKLLGNR